MKLCSKMLWCYSTKYILFKRTLEMYGQFKFILYLFCIIHPIASELDHDNPIVSVVHKTLKATARSCMGHVNATEADLEFLRKDPPFPEKSACIITCLLEKIGIVDDGKYSKMGFMTIVSPLVFRNRTKLEHMNTVSENCDKEVNRGGSACQLGNEITICIFKYAPELHFKS